MRNLLLFIALNTGSVYLASQLLDSFVVSGGALGYLIVGIILGLLNLILKPVLRVLSLPFIFLTAGLFVIVLNAAILWVSEYLISFLDLPGIALSIQGFGTYVAAVVFLGFLNYFFQKVLR